MRTLDCTKCGQPVRVREIIRKNGEWVEQEHIDPALFVGGCCLKPKDQLPLEDEPETHEYDPAKAAIPF